MKKSMDKRGEVLSKERKRCLLRRLTKSTYVILKGEDTPSMTHASVHIQIAPESAPTTPCWFAEVAMVAQCLKTYGLVDLIETKVRFARARFDHYDLIDFVAVLIGYALSGEPTLQAFYTRLAPFSTLFMALFGRFTRARDTVV